MANPTTAIPRRLAAPALRRPSAATGVLVALLIAAAAVLMYAGRHLTFFADEWVWILDRRGGGINSLLKPYNDHFSLFPLAVYRLLFALVGIRHYTVYRAVGVGLHLVCAVLLYILIRRRVGPWLALVPTTLLLFMGTAAQDLLWPIAIGFLGSIAGGLGALALIENRRSDALAAVLLVFSIASSGVGLAFLVAGLVAIIARRDPWSRLWVIAMPALVFLAWYAGWGQSKPVTVSAILGVPASIADAAAGVSSAIAGLNTATGPTVVNPWGPAIALVGGLVVAVSWRQNVGRQPTPMLLAAVAGVLTFWGLVALQRYAFANLNTSRYLYIGAVFVWLIVAEARVGTKLTGAWLAFAGLLAAGALIANLRDLRHAEIGLRTHDDVVRASLTAVDVAAPVVSPGFVADPVGAPVIIAGPYLAAAHDLGTPAFPLAELPHLPYSVRRRIDIVLERAEALSITTAAASVGCRLTAPLLPRPAVALELFPGHTVAIRDLQSSSVKIYLRRFLPVFGPPRFALLPGHSTSTVHFPVDSAPGVPWHLLVVPGHGVATCLR